MGVVCDSIKGCNLAVHLPSTRGQYELSHIVAEQTVSSVKPDPHLENKLNSPLVLNFHGNLWSGAEILNWGNCWVGALFLNPS